MFSEESYSIPVRIAHEEAIEARRQVRRRVEARYRELIQADIAAENAVIEARVAKVMQAEIDAGVSRGEVRRALKTNANSVWQRYMRHVAAPVREKDFILYVGETIWNLSTRRVKTGDKSHPILALERAEDGLMQVYAAAGAQFHEKPDDSQRMEIDAAVTSGRLEPFGPGDDK